MKLLHRLQQSAVQGTLASLKKISDWEDIQRDLGHKEDLWWEDFHCDLGHTKLSDYPWLVTQKNLGGCIIDQGSLKMEHLGKCKKKFLLHPDIGCMSRARFLIHSLMEVLVKGDIASNELRPLGRKKLRNWDWIAALCATQLCLCVQASCVPQVVSVSSTFPQLLPRRQSGREPLCSKVKSASPFLAPKHLSLTYFQRCQGSGVCPFGANFLQTVAGTKERRRRDPCT